MCDVVDVSCTKPVLHLEHVELKSWPELIGTTDNITQEACINLFENWIHITSHHMIFRTVTGNHLTPLPSPNQC